MSDNENGKGHLIEEYEEVIEKTEEKVKDKKSKKSSEKNETKNKKSETKSNKKKEEEEEEEEDEESEEESDEESEDKNKDNKSKGTNKKNPTKSEQENNSSNKITDNKKRTNLKRDYSENEIIEMAGFKIEKSSKENSNLSDQEENNKEIPIEEKIKPDSPEIRKLRIQAAKLKNEFPNWSKISDTKGGDLAVKCWNCENINICNYNSNVIQCPVCHEMNTVPKPMDRIDELLQLAKANTCVTYSDINHTVPLVNYIVVCPYCKCDNKVRETAYFCVCYMCKNRWTIKRPDPDNVKEIKNKKQPKQKRFEGNYYKYDSKTGTLIPPDKPLRFSDLFYPDPMFYPGYYPINSLSPLYPEYFTPYDDYRYIDRQEKTMKYFDRVNQQKKMMEQFGDILEDNDNITNNNINNNSNNTNNITNLSINTKRKETPISKKYEKPYYHLNYEEDMNKKDVLRQLEALDKKSENLMKNRIFPKALTEISSEQSKKALKSRYNGLRDSNYDEDEGYKSRASMNISSIKSDLRAPAEMNKSINKSINNMSKSNSQYSKNQTLRDNESSYGNTNNRNSQNDVSSKIKSIESTYFMNNK